MKTFAGLTLDRPRIMGIVNVTPDSFSDGGDAFACDDAVRRGLAMVKAGADIVDVGGESTRPGADSVSLDEEIRRTIPVIERLVHAGALVSIDTRHVPVMKAAINVGARIVNDVSALTEAGALDAIAHSDACVVLMHMQGEPKSMQDNPQYRDVVTDVFDYLNDRVAVCGAVGISKIRIAVDPGIGFGKTVGNNLDILNRLERFSSLGVPLLLGVSRKSFIGAIAHEPNAKNRLPGSLAAGLWAVHRGANILRVHDVVETVQAVNVWHALKTVSS